MLVGPPENKTITRCKLKNQIGAVDFNSLSSRKVASDVMLASYICDEALTSDSLKQLNRPAFNTSLS